MGKILGLTSGIDFATGTPRFSMTPAPTTTLFVVPTPRVERTTLEEAKRLATFHLSVPTYLPPGFSLQSITRVGDDFGFEYTGPAPGGRRGYIGLDQRYAPPGVLPPGMTPPATPDIPRETALVHNKQALVVRSFPAPAWYTPEAGSSSLPSLEWGENNVQYVVGGSVGLGELVRVANSLK
jgi:hypothetical protein